MYGMLGNTWSVISLQEEQGQFELLNWEGDRRIVDIAALLALGGWGQTATLC